MICQEPLQKVNKIILSCTHEFCATCILNNLKYTRKCPLCRFEIVKDPVDADYVIVNTCGFLDEARQESIDIILDLERIRKNDTIKSLIVAGCMSERFENEMKKELIYVDHFFGTNDSNKIIDFICSKEHEKFDPDFNRIHLFYNGFG